MKKTLSFSQVAEMTGCSRTTISRRAKTEGWNTFQVANRQKMVDIEDLPAAIKDIVESKLIRAEAAAIRADQRKAGIDPNLAIAPCRKSQPRTKTPEFEVIEARGEWYAKLPPKMREEAEQRLVIMDQLIRFRRQGQGKMESRQSTVAWAKECDDVKGKISTKTLSRWENLVAWIPRPYWLYYLAPSYARNGNHHAEFPGRSLDIFKTDYLRPEKPSFTACYRRLEGIAKVKGWTLPSLRTFKRVIEKIDKRVVVLKREGEEALMAMYPAQERDTSGFTALEGVNADGHVFDVRVEMPDGSIIRPLLVGVQDLFSGKIIGWHVGFTESSDLIRLAFRDAITKYGIPKAAWLDNGRAFASKMLTGGVKNRFRFKVKKEEPQGILTALGIEIHWVTPYHGQAKPIERSWRDLCEDIARHPKAFGAYTGKDVVSKPANYGSKAVAWDDFVQLVDEQIAEHNARKGRRTQACRGELSFDDAFAASYAKSVIKKASPEQLRQLMLCSEAVTASRRDGSVRLSGNRYWNETLSDHMGQKVLLRFDPNNLHGQVSVYALNGQHICDADCIHKTGFADKTAAKEHATAKRQHKKHTKKAAEAEVRMNMAELQDQLSETSPPPENLPPAKVIQPIFNRQEKAAEQTVPLKRTGTDDAQAREDQMFDLMERLDKQSKNKNPWD